MVSAAAGVLLVVASTVAPGRPSGPPVARPEWPVTATDLYDKPSNNSPVLAVDPTERRFVVVANRLDAPFSCALQASGDSGRSWVTALPVPKLPRGAMSCYAPEVGFDSKGRLYFLFVALAGGGNRPMGAFLTTSDTRARTWTAPRQVLPAERYMVRMAVDPGLGERGRIHVVWLEPGSSPPAGGFAPSPNPIMAAYSDDGGHTFSKARQVSDTERPRAVAPAVAVGRDHAVHILYYDLVGDTRDYQGLEGPVWEDTWSLVMTTSTDGGNTFRPGTVVEAGVVPPDRVMLIYTMPPPSLAADLLGRVYVAWHDARNGDWDVFVRRSADGGRTWAGPTRVNDDRKGDGRHQYLPRLAVAPGGRLDVVFYDRRRHPDNRGNDVAYTYSTDGGATFAPNLRLTDMFFDSLVGPRYTVASAQGLVEFGGRIALVSERGRALAAWTDTRYSRRANPSQDIFAAEVGFPRRGGMPGWARPAGYALLAASLAGVAATRRRRENAEAGR